MPPKSKPAKKVVPKKEPPLILLHNVYSTRKVNKVKQPYGLAGDEIELISEHGDVLIVAGKVHYTMTEKGGLVKVNERFTFPVERKETNIDNRDAKPVIEKIEEVAQEIAPNKRPSYGAPRASRKRF